MATLSSRIDSVTSSINSNKSALRTSLINKGVTIASSPTFAQIKAGIDSIKINPSAKYPYDYLKDKCNTYSLAIDYTYLYSSGRVSNYEAFKLDKTTIFYPLVYVTYQRKNSIYYSNFYLKCIVQNITTKTLTITKINNTPSDSGYFLKHLKQYQITSDKYRFDFINNNNNLYSYIYTYNTNTITNLILNTSAQIYYQYNYNDDTYYHNITNIGYKDSTYQYFLCCNSSNKINLYRRKLEESTSTTLSSSVGAFLNGNILFGIEDFRTNVYKIDNDNIYFIGTWSPYSLNNATNTGDYSNFSKLTSFNKSTYTFSIIKNTNEIFGYGGSAFGWIANNGIGNATSQKYIFSYKKNNTVYWINNKSGMICAWDIDSQNLPSNFRILSFSFPIVFNWIRSDFLDSWKVLEFPNSLYFVATKCTINTSTNLITFVPCLVEIPLSALTDQ